MRHRSLASQETLRARLGGCRRYGLDELPDAGRRQMSADDLFSGTEERRRRPGRSDILGRGPKNLASERLQEMGSAQRTLSSGVRGPALGVGRRISLPWVADSLCEPDRAKRHVIGLSGNITPPRRCRQGHPVHWAPAKSLRDVPPELWDLFSTNYGGHGQEHAAPGTLSEQEAFVRAFLTGSP